MTYRALALAAALLVSGCGGADTTSPDAVLAMLEQGDRGGCKAALPLVAEEVRRIDHEFGWEWVADELNQRTAVTGRDAEFVSFDPQNRSMRCEAWFDIDWIDGTAQGAKPEPGADGYYLVQKDGGFVIRLTAPESGAEWSRPQARARYAAMRDHLIAERLQAPGT
ncbi:hypothetical protein [Brevundimonas sp. M20]|uniref:hypothetical protein n=1 Tax=Brevundimonas sp. M20 TaxID=2591463 RepID=UPI001146F3A1|nr:hypothetical protein [Brevundimonas sp. M20]QDH74581.1 hypothetical protein FKQ52_14890 [Brevundimonas sp. M20]